MYIRRLPSKRYQCVIRLKGHKLSKTFTQRSDAKTWGREQEYLIETSNLVRVPKNLTLRVLINEYREHSLPNLKDSYGVNNQLNRLCDRFKWLIDKPYDALKPLDFEKFKSMRLKDIGNHHIYKNNHRAANKDLRILSVIINKAISLQSYTITNHIYSIKYLPHSRGLYRPIRYYEHRTLLKLANKNQKAVLLLLRHTGARPKEIFNLSWNCLDEYKNELLIPSNINKTYTSRVIPLNKYLIDWLFKNLDNNTKTITNISYTAFRFWLIRKTKKLNFKEFSMYHYRRYFVQYYANKGLPLPKLALLTGHKSYSMIARYYGHYVLSN